MTVRIVCGHVLDALAALPEASVQCIVTSPPYFGMRDYGTTPQVWPDGWVGELGQEETVQGYVDHLVAVGQALRRVLREDGVLWLNLGDCYWRKNLHGLPWRVVFALQADGWLLRTEIVWDKCKPMPEPVRDRPTRTHEYVFELTKARAYFYDQDGERGEWADERRGRAGGSRPAQRNVGGRTDGLTRPPLDWAPDAAQTGPNLRTVWRIPARPNPVVHYAVFPEALPRRCVRLSSRPGDTVLDPFAGTGTTGLVADEQGREAILIEVNPADCRRATERIEGRLGRLFTQVEVVNAAKAPRADVTGYPERVMSHADAGKNGADDGEPE